jgi:adenine-specific DNA-methyltransferase
MWPPPEFKISREFDESADVIYYHGDCNDLLKQIPPRFVQLVMTSPPYNIGKSYERIKVDLNTYLKEQEKVIKSCITKLSDTGSICWEVGNYIKDSSVIPLDIFLYPCFKDEVGNQLKLRNRIVWHFEHGLHSSRRFSGRYETILWFTKTDDYYFNLDGVRVPQKYPLKKHYKGPNFGKYSGNPFGKNPGDVWIFPNVKWNHPEKTEHPCQFPVELVQRLVLALTKEGDWVLDPYIGVGSTAVGAVLRKRKAVGAEIVERYVQIGLERLRKVADGTLKIRPMERPVYMPIKTLEKDRDEQKRMKSRPLSEYVENY